MAKMLTRKHPISSVSFPVLLLGLLLSACGGNNSIVPQSTVDQTNQQNNPSNVQPIAPQPITGRSRSLLITPTAVSTALVEQADAAQQVLVNIYQRTESSVVNIEIIGADDRSASGSGFLYDTAGHIVTNSHVVQGAKSLLVTFHDGSVAEPKIVATDDYSDLAVLKVDISQKQLAPVTLGDSSKLKVGQRVAVIGNPFGLLSSMTIGIISATGRTLQSAYLLNPGSTSPARDYSNPSIIQVDAQINPGNSGGPLLDIYGQVIGVVTAIRTEPSPGSPIATFQGVGFAVPSNTVKRVVPQLINNGKVEYSWLGIRSVSGRSSLSVAALSKQLNLPVNHGVLVSEVVPDSPAALAGVRGGNQKLQVRGVEIITGGDIIVAINGQPIRDMDALLAYLVENTTPGDTITLTIIRDNQTLEAKVALKPRPAGES
jgi:2-alkenal reductase